MSELPTGPAETADDEMHARPQGLMIRFAKLWLTGLVTTVLLGIGGAFAICPCGDGICGGDSCIPPETPHSCPADCGEPTEPTDVMNFHFDEPLGANAFKDMSAANLAATCTGTCPVAGGLGLRGTPKHSNSKLAPRFLGDDCLQIPDNDAHEIVLSPTGVTFSAWVYPDDLPESSTMTILSKWHTGGNSREWLLGVSTDASGVARFKFWKSADGSSATIVSVSSTYQLRPRTWQHVGLVISPTGTATFYVNGVWDSTGSVGTTFRRSTSATRIGCAYSGGPVYYFRGKIDEIFMAHSTATASEMNAYYTWSIPNPHISYVSGTLFDPSITVNVQDMPGMAEVGTYNLNQTTGLPRAVRDLGMDSYGFFIRRDSVCQPTQACDDWGRLDQFLGDNDGSLAPRIDVVGDIAKGMFGYGYYPYESSPDPSCAGEPTRARRWGCAINHLRAAHPNLIAWSLDDFFRTSSEGESASFRNRQTLLDFCNALPRDPTDPAKPLIPVYATIYCDGGDGKDGTGLFECDGDGQNAWGDNPDSRPFSAGGEWCRRTAPDDGAYTQDDALADYLTSTNVTTNEALRKCLTGVNLYINAAYSAGEATIKKCVNHFSRLQQNSPFLEIRLGVYVAEVTGPNTCDHWRQNVEVSQRIAADGYTFFVLPPTNSSCGTGGWTYSWMKSQTNDPMTYVDWDNY